MKEDPSWVGPRHQQWEQMAHDIKGHLAVVSLGLEALSGVRNDADKFAAAVEAIRKDGMEPLKQAIAALISRASKQQH